ncbi:hypothetical protein HBB16_02425 [Pseudonocardia sp. MCCB 268]|nr:hypothetical protein [Pseudonocardia cytotoxica]
MTVAAAPAGRARGAPDPPLPVASYVPDFAEVQVRGLRRRHPEAAGSEATGDRQAPDHAHLAWATGSGTPSSRSTRSVTACRTSCPGHTAFKAPMVADLGTRFEYGINTDWLSGGRGGRRAPRSTSKSRRTSPEPLGMDDTMFSPDEARQANKTPVHVMRTAGDLGRQRPPDDYRSGGLRATAAFTYC